MDTCSPTLLSQTDDGCLYVLGCLLSLLIGTSGHYKVCVLINDHHKIRKIFMSIGRKKVTVLIFLVVQLEIIDTGKGKKVVPFVHLYAEGIEHLLRLFRILDDCVLLFLLFARRHRQDSKIMFQERII